MNRSRSTILRTGAICVALASLFFCPGCVLPGEGSRQLTFTPENRKIDYELRFDKAYAAPAQDGGYDLVLTSAFEMHSPVVSDRIYPAVVPPVSQVLHVHVAWRPARGSKSDFPAATNSSVHWEIYRGESRSATDRAVYEGVGYVSAEISEHESVFSMRDVLVKPEQVTGSMRDPLGSCRISGKVRAQNDASAVQRILQSLAANSAAEAAGTEGNR